MIDGKYCTHWKDFTNFIFGNINRVICTTGIIKAVHITIPIFFPLFKRSYVDTDVYNGLLDSEGEGEGGTIWENGNSNRYTVM